MANPLIAGALVKLSANQIKRALKNLGNYKNITDDVKGARKKSRAVDRKSGFARGVNYDSELREVAEALKDKKAGGGKVGNKYFTGGMVNPSYGTDFDDR